MSAREVTLPCKHTIDVNETVQEALRVVGPLPMQCTECGKRYRLGWCRDYTIRAEEINECKD
jgi:hypothetical protein